jgi:hypothetical protein
MNDKNKVAESKVAESKVAEPVEATGASTSSAPDREIEAIKPPPLAGSFTLSKDRKLWIAGDDTAKQQVENYLKEFGEKAAKEIRIK